MSWTQLEPSTNSLPLLRLKGSKAHQRLYIITVPFLAHVLQAGWMSVVNLYSDFPFLSTQHLEKQGATGPQLCLQTD